MWKIPEYNRDVSLIMSRVMDEIGVNEDIVLRRRKSVLLREELLTLTQQLRNRDKNAYFFGSQIEGTTTLGLDSDVDCLFTFNDRNVIQDLNELEQGKQNLLMIQDETVSPGYCLLQEISDDAQLPQGEINELSFRDERGRILLPNTIFNDVGITERVRHGPAQSKQGSQGFYDTDCVPAYSCQTYPVQARRWSDRHRVRYWPSNDIIQYCYNTGFFVVAVGNKRNENGDIEWRISTSLAERCLMCNLNITQIRCYVLMKMILKTFITPLCPESISSFMCKTVLLHCISNTRVDEWKDSTLLTCLSFCLSTLYSCVLNEYCPHFFIQENNLMMRRFSQNDKQFTLKVLYNVIESNEKALLLIKCDKFGLRLQYNLNGIRARNRKAVSIDIAGQLLWHTALDISCCFRDLLCEIKNTSSRSAARKMSSMMSKIINTRHTNLYSKCLIAQQLCHTMGTILASSIICRNGNISYKALSLMSLGLHADVASGKLKLASVFYCIGETERAELVLKNIEECYDLCVVEPICLCHIFKSARRRERFNRLCYKSSQEHTLLKYITASCVCFSRCEVSCCPFELRREMFRSTLEDFSYRRKIDDWMDMAVVDSLPYLYFLQYKTYTRLGKEEERKKALSNLMRTIQNEANLGHRETAFNLLGQCMEIDNRKDYALKCYMLSLNVRGRNNAAKLLICRLLRTVANERES